LCYVRRVLSSHYWSSLCEVVSRQTSRLALCLLNPLECVFGFAQHVSLHKVSFLP